MANIGRAPARALHSCSGVRLPAPTAHFQSEFGFFQGLTVSPEAKKWGLTVPAKFIQLAAFVVITGWYRSSHTPCVCARCIVVGHAPAPAPHLVRLGMQRVWGWPWYGGGGGGHVARGLLVRGEASKQG